MATKTLRNPVTVPDATPEAPVRPVIGWAVTGAVCLGLIAYSWGRWLLGGHAEAVPAGPTSMPGAMTAVIRIFEVFYAVALPALFWFVVIRPWRRDRRPTSDGLLVVGMLSAFMLLDNIQNYSQFWYTFNAKFVNLGCPQCYLPGWQSDASRFPVPLFFATGFYVVGMFCVAVVLSAVMRRAKVRWPHLRPFGLIGCAYGVGVVLDFVMEIFFARMGFYTLGGAGRDVSLFAGRYYQFPIYEAFTAPLWFAALGATRYFTQLRGRGPAEQGLERVATSERRRTGLRVLGAIGFCNVLTLVAYIAPQYVTAIHSDSWPRDVTDRSYFGVCGPDTGIPCPGPQED